MTQLIRTTQGNGYPTVFNTLFEDFFRDLGTERPLSQSLIKSHRSTEKENEYLLSLDLPGVGKDDAHVEVDNGVLTVRAERKDFWAIEGTTTNSYSKFERSFTLPTSVDVEKIDAQMENGVLNIVLPKLAASQARKIAIGSGNSGNKTDKKAI